MATSPDGPKYEFNLEEMAAALMRARGISSGLWRLAIGFSFAATGASMRIGESTSICPAGIAGVTGAALFEGEQGQPLVFDARVLAAKYGHPVSPGKAPYAAKRPAAKKAVGKRRP